MKKIVILTGSELRHTFFRKLVSQSKEISVINSYCEGQEKSTKSLVKKGESIANERLRHLSARSQSERDFFELFVQSSKDYSNPVNLRYGDINNDNHVQEIINSNPDLIVSYGCSIINSSLLTIFEGRFINVHLGLSPYYRGSGTNFWPLVNNEPEYIGATFMYIDSGIDTGKIIHQIRPEIFIGDTPHQIGNRFILLMSNTYKDIIINFDKLKKLPQSLNTNSEKLYREKDFTEESVISMYKNFQTGLVKEYLKNRIDRCKKVPILQNDSLGV
jgi:phosphoribosylglycinamide formyltransferase 1